MTARYLLLLFISALFAHVLCQKGDGKGPFKDLSDKAKKLLKDGDLDKLSGDDLKKVKPKDIWDIAKDKLKGAGKEKLKNFTKIIGKGGKEDVRNFTSKLNCSQLRDVLNETSKWNCALLKGLLPALGKCKKGHPMKMKNMTGMYNLKPLARCGLLDGLVDKDDFKELAKDGGFKKASKDAKKKYAEKAKEYYGRPEDWTEDVLDDLEDIIPDIKSKDLKKVPKDVLKKSLGKGRGKKMDKQKKSDLFRHLFKGKKNLTAENISWACDAGFESEFRPKDIKHLPAKSLKMHAKCLGRAHSSVKKEFVKRVCSKQMNFDNDTAKVCVHALEGMKPSDLKNDTVVEFLLEQYLKLSDKNKPKLKNEVCRRLAKAFTMKHGRNPKVKPGPLVKCMNRSAKEIVEDKDNLKEIAKSKKNKGLRREVLKELLKNQTKYGKILQQFVNEMTNEELGSLDLGLDDEDGDEILEDDENKGACSNDDDDDDEDDEEEEEDDDDNGDDVQDSDDEEVKFCDMSKRFVVLKGIGRISDLTVQKIVKIARLLLHGGLTEMNIDDLNEEEYATIVAILSKRENVFSIRQAKKIVKKYRKLYRNNTEALDDMEGMIAFFNMTELESILPDKCEEVIMKLRESGFLWRLAPKVRKGHVKFVVSKCIKDLSAISADELVNLGHLIGWLDKDQLDQIPGQLLVENLEEFRDNLEEQMMHMGFKHLIKNITKKIVEKLGGASVLTVDHIADFGVLRKGLDKDDIKKFQPEAQEELAVYEEDLDEEGAMELFDGGDASKRRKRATTDYSSKDADYFLDLGQIVLGLPEAGITTVTDAVFEDIVGTVSEISGWNSGQLTKWAEKAVSAWGAPNNFTSDELLRLNNFAKGFSASHLNSMDFSSNDVIASFGLVSGYTAAQAENIFAKVKTNTPVSSMTGSDLLRLGSIALGMTTVDIGNINAEAFKIAVSEFGKMTGWSESQLVALKDKAVAVYGATSGWDGALLSTVNVIIGGFTNSEVQNLDADDLQYISNEAIASMPPSKFKLLSSDLIGQLDAEQAQSVTDGQIQELSEAQKSALASAESGDSTTPNTTSSSTTASPGDNGSTQSIFGIVSIILPLLCSRFLT